MRRAEQRGLGSVRGSGLPRVRAAADVARRAVDNRRLCWHDRAVDLGILGLMPQTRERLKVVLQC
jgi:hypothetical protein